jgi:hypothetical protein
MPSFFSPRMADTILGPMTWKKIDRDWFPVCEDLAALARLPGCNESLRIDVDKAHHRPRDA